MNDIKPEGIGESFVTPQEAFEPATPQEKISTAATLQELAADFVFFTPALLFTHGGLDRDPVQEFVNEADGTPALTIMSYDKPIFRGMRFPDGQRGWNFRLLGIERGCWNALLAFLGNLVILDTPKKTVYRVRPFSVMVADPVVMNRAAVLPDPVPMIEVVVFGLEGNIRTVLVKPTPKPGVVCPQVVVGPPDPLFVARAAKILAKQDPGHEPIDPGTAHVFDAVSEGVV